LVLPRLIDQIIRRCDDAIEASHAFAIERERAKRLDALAI
jgi:hypothetical protein